MGKGFDGTEISNVSVGAALPHDFDSGRRVLLKGGLGAAMAAAFGGLSGCSTLLTGGAVKLGFKGIAASLSDALIVPDGYTATPFMPWGEPVGALAGMPAWKSDASNTAAEQALQMGMHHDGMHYFPTEGSKRGLLVMNHEYVDDGLLHADGLKTWSLEKVRKSQASHGISVIEIEDKNGQWHAVRPSRFARRITANTPMKVGGPAAGNAMMKTAADPSGTTVLGTFNNCAAGITPWGTYLSGEENFRFYFAGGENITDPHMKRWGLNKGAFFRWPELDERFDAQKTPNEMNRFGWVVELDPADPTSVPVKRTALGRAAHEGAWVAITKDNRAVVYSGEDARFEYIYKFVSRDKIREAGNGLTKAQANSELLDHGTLYVARFDADGRGRWLPLVAGVGPLTAANGFANTGDVVIKARQASDALGGTKMDRPEWIAIDQARGEVYCTLTNNSQRGVDDNPGVDAANPRARNNMGHIIKWKEDNDFDALSFSWSHWVLAGDPANQRADAKGNIRGDLFACPDGLTLDDRGIMWIQTDAAAAEMGKGEFQNIGGNQMLACDLATGDIRRFLAGPANCEITGCTFTPDGRTMFVNIQHPGETPSERGDPSDPMRFSKWPDGASGGRPRSSTVVIRKVDGGVIGT
ncbi:MAG: PhoX family phosphatase [Betaproteobacteria bacterium]|nr:MAG: PhoX family phosphatase [Betaproteobacteria bacterium]